MESAPGLLPVDRLESGLRPGLARVLRPRRPGSARRPGRFLLGRALLDQPARRPEAPVEGAAPHAGCKDLAALPRAQGMGGVCARRPGAVETSAAPARQLAVYA